MALLHLEPLSIEASPSMYTLSAGVIQGLPQLDQNHEPTSDHAADENARMNCVFTGNAAVARKVGGHPDANGDAIKDGCAHYGQDYTGGADEGVVESDGCLDHRWGIHADTFHASTRAGLLNECKRQADLGNFTMVTIPSMWGSQPSQPGYNPDSPNFWTHACIYVGYVGDTHYLMNPWGGFIMTYSSAELILRLCFLKVYPISKATSPTPQVNPMIDIERDAKNNITGAHDHDNPKLHVLAGVAAAIEANKQTDHHIFMGERYFGSRAVAILSTNDKTPVPDSIYTYSAQYGVRAVMGNPDLAMLLSDRIVAADKPAAPPLTPKQQAAIDLGKAFDAYEAVK